MSYSAPTSLGKSFLMRMLIKEKIQKGQQCCFAILVPTRALISEVTEKLTDTLGDLLQQRNYRIVNSASALSRMGREHCFLFVVTPERMLSVMNRPEAVPIDYLFVDEAHKLSECDGRTAFYYKVVQMAVQRQPQGAHVCFASPSIANPEVFFGVIPEDCRGHSIATRYAPVSQLKFLLDYRAGEISIVNDRSDTIEPLGPLKGDWLEMLAQVGQGRRNIVYCAGREFAMQQARAYAEGLEPLHLPELEGLAVFIRSAIHEDFDLAELVRRGVAYHVGFLPAALRMQIETLYRENKLHTIFCTRTLLEGVNLPADNLFVTSAKSGKHPLSPVDFRNLIGRVGRIEFNLYGNVFLLCLKRHTKAQAYETLVRGEMLDLQLPLSPDRLGAQMEQIVSTLAKGELPRFEDKSPIDPGNAQNAFLRKVVNMLLRDIMTGENTRTVRAFQPFLDRDRLGQIRARFADRSALMDDDITASVEQNQRLREALLRHWLTIPPRTAGEQEILTFLEQLCEVFQWEAQERFTLGYRNKDGVHSRLMWYAHLTMLWISGARTGEIIQDSLKHYQEKGEVWVHGKPQPFDPGSEQQRNQIIADVLRDIDNILLFRLSTYLNRLSTVYQSLYQGKAPSPDWYEFVEYGSTYPIPIFLQRSGFSRDSALHLARHNQNSRYVYKDERGHYRLRRAVLDCPEEGVRRDGRQVYHNLRELFEQ